MYRAFYREFKSKPTNAQDKSKYKTPTYVSANKLPSSGVSIKELQARTASKYTIVGFTAEVFTQLTILKCIDA